MMSASKILKKYRRSSNKRLASISYTDESVLNYDTFEVCPKDIIILKSNLTKPFKIITGFRLK